MFVLNYKLKFILYQDTLQKENKELKIFMKNKVEKLQKDVDEIKELLSLTESRGVHSKVSYCTNQIEYGNYTSTAYPTGAFLINLRFAKFYSGP